MEIFWGSNRARKEGQIVEKGNILRGGGKSQLHPEVAIRSMLRNRKTNWKRERESQSEEEVILGKGGDDERSARVVMKGS